MRYKILAMIVPILLILPIIASAQVNPQYSPLKLVFPSQETEVYGQKITEVLPETQIKTFLFVGNPSSNYSMTVHVKTDGNISNWINFDNTTLRFDPHTDDNTYWSDRINITIDVPRECKGAYVGFDGLTYTERYWEEYEVPAGKYAINLLPKTPCVFRGKWYGNITTYEEGPYAGQGRWETQIILSPEVPAVVGGQSIIVASGIPVRIFIKDYNFWEYINLPTFLVFSILAWIIILLVVSIGVPSFYFFYWKSKQPKSQQ